MPDKEEKNGLNLKLVWSIMSFSILLALGGLGAFASTQSRVAVLETENKNNQAMMKIIFEKVENIENILMHPIQ